jgi:hypothetical protein
MEGLEKPLEVSIKIAEIRTGYLSNIVRIVTV